MLATLMEKEPDGVGLIYIAPIKALLNNQAERLATYTRMVGLRRFVWHGDIKDSQKRSFIKEPAQNPNDHAGVAGRSCCSLQKSPTPNFLETFAP
jgi:hypothetical protein